MGFLENTVITVKKTGKAIGLKANEQYGVIKKKVGATEVKNKIKAAYTEIGAAVYEAEKNNTDCKDKIEPYINLIDDLNAQLDEIQAEIDRLKKAATCPNCQHVNQSTADYCSACGTKLEK